MVHFLSIPAPFLEKEQAYLAVRTKEGRVLSDEAVRQLPFVSPTPAMAKEWTWRRRSFQRFRRYLRHRYGRHSIRILDLGCGNGWMANGLAAQTNWEVWGVDVNQTELEQGDRLFARENLRFVFADVLSDVLPAHTFDVVVLAASAQYFPQLPTLVTALKRTLRIGGEIHFLDTPFYADLADCWAAQARTALYYNKMGAPEMTDFYHHHSWRVVAQLGGQQLWAFSSGLLKKMGYLAPFPWVRLINRDNVSSGHRKSQSGGP